MFLYGAINLSGGAFQILLVNIASAIYSENLETSEILRCNTLSKSAGARA